METIAFSYALLVADVLACSFGYALNMGDIAVGVLYSLVAIVIRTS
jgi:hypothetical protein